MKDQLDAIRAEIETAEAALARARGLLASLSMERVADKFTGGASGYREVRLPDQPVAALHDEPPSRPA